MDTQPAMSNKETAKKVIQREKRWVCGSCTRSIMRSRQHRKPDRAQASAFGSSEQWPLPQLLLDVLATALA